MPCIGWCVGDFVARHVGPLEQHVSPLMVVVHRVVDGDVNGPFVAVLVGVQGPGSVFRPLGHTVSVTVGGPVVCALEPHVS